jgi:hypothetical protein
MKMQWLILAFALQLGYTPNNSAVLYTPPPFVLNQAAQGIISMDVEARLWGVLYLGGDLGVTVWNCPSDGIPSFWPDRLQSTVRAGIRFGGIEIGWSHLCTHPVMPYQPLINEQAIWDGAYDEIHVKFSGEIHF